MAGECISMFQKVDPLECFLTDGFTLTHACLSTCESLFLMAVTVTHLWLMYEQQKEIACGCFLLISDGARFVADCGSHTKFTSTKQMGRGKKEEERFCWRGG